MASNKITEIIKVSEIWPDSDNTILLFLGSAEPAPFAVWAENKSDNSKFITEKYFQTNDSAQSAFDLLTEVLCEIGNPLTEILRKTPINRPQ